MLFDACKKWLQSKGMEAMDGPINFGSRDRWWGLLIEGYDREPNYQCNYNFAYYKDFFESYGFQVYFYQLTYGRQLMVPAPEKVITLLHGFTERRGPDKVVSEAILEIR